MITDITELRDAEGAWRQSYEELRTIYECMVDGLLIADVETKEFLQANRAICQMLGYTPEELLAMSVLDIHPQEDLPAVLEGFQSQAAELFARADALPVCRKDGSVFYADVTANRIVYNGRPCLIGFFRDITERRKAEEATRQSEAKYRALVESCPDAVAMTDLQGRVVFASERAAEQHGFQDPGELLGRQATEFVVAGDRARFVANVGRLLEEGLRKNDQYTGIRRDGTTFDAEISSAVMRDAAGKPEALMGVYRDVTERKLAEKRLRAKDSELLAAAEIQAHLLPQESPRVPGFEIAGRCYPAEVAAGDHFDYLWLPDGSLLVVLGDVSGHGIGPALVATDFCARLRTLSESQCELPEMAVRVNSGLHRETGGEVFVTALLGRLDPKSRSLTYLNAGHPAAIVLDSAGEVKARLASSGPPFAILPQVSFAASDPVELSDGDLVFFYTDGLVEVHRPGQPLFGIHRVLQIIQANRDRTAAEIIESLYAAVCQYAQPGKPHDDITAVVVKVLASASETSPAPRQLDRSETSPPARADSGTSRSTVKTEYFSVEQGDDVTIVRLRDMKHFDAENYAQLQQHLVGLVERQQPPKLLVDLGNVEYCATALINVLLTTQKSVQARSGVTKLCALREVLLETLQCLKLDGTVFSVYADETDAKNAF